MPKMMTMNLWTSPHVNQKILYDDNIKFMNMKEGGGGKNTIHDNEKLMNINKGEGRTQEMTRKKLWSSNKEN